MRLIDADKAKAELLAIDETIPAWPGFFDGLKTGYQSAADRLDTMSVVEERKHGHWEDIDLDTSVCSVCKNRKNTKQNTARSAALKWKIMEMNKYIQQFLDDNDLQAGERFYILDKDYKKMFNKTFYINKNATGTDDILLDNNHFAIYSDTLLYLLTGIAFVKKNLFVLNMVKWFIMRLFQVIFKKSDLIRTLHFINYYAKQENYTGRKKKQKDI